MSRIKELTGVNKIDFSVKNDRFNDMISRIEIKNFVDNRGKSLFVRKDLKLNRVAKIT
jgi:hypothetical protein